MSEDHHWRALIYNRASHDPVGQTVSVESQETENRAWCERQGWHVAGVVTDNDRSATRFATKEREGYKSIKQGLGTGRWGRIDVLVTWASSRNQRRLDGYVDLRELCVRHGVRLAYKGRVFDLNIGSDRFQTGLDALLDERDAEEIRDGILRSHRASVAAGRPRGSIPYGYTRTYLPGLRRVGEQIPDPETAPIVQGIVADLLGGHTLYSIAQRLNREGAPTPQQVRDGRRERVVERSGWTSSMIRSLLSKPSLAGLRSHRGVIVGEGTWEPIVSSADWYAVQALLRSPQRVAHHGGLDVKWLLSGIAECGVCGAWLRPMRREGRMTYACAGVTPTSPKGHVARSQEALDAYVSLAVVQRFSQPGWAEVFVPPARPGGRAEMAARELDYVRAQLAEYEASAGTPGGVSAAAFARIEARLQARIAELEAEVAPMPVLPAVVARVAAGDAVAVWDGLGMEDRRVVVRALCTVAVLPVTRRGVRGFDPGSVRLEWLGAPTPAR